MEKKNTLLLTVIAVATLLVAVVGATFAYFGTFTQDTNQNTKVNVTTQAAKTSTFVTGETSIELTVKSADMIKGTDSASKEVANDTKNITATLTSADTQLYTVCSFDVVYVADPANTEAKVGEYKAKTAGVTGNEFTYTIGTAQKGTDSTGEGNVAPGTITGTTETQYDTIATGEEVTVISGAQVSARGGKTTINFPVTVKFYNIPSVDQSKLSDLSFTGKFIVKTTPEKCTSQANDIA